MAASRARSAGSPAWVVELASEDGELLAQHQDLQVLGDAAAGEQGEELDGAAQREVGGSGQHARSSPKVALRTRRTIPALA
jgi:hypothetical protein